MREFRPRVVPVGDAAGAHAAARHRLWRVAVERTSPPSDARDSRRAVASAVDFLRRSVRDRPSIGRDAAPVRVAEWWRTVDGTAHHVAGRTDADSALLGERLRATYGEEAVTAVEPTAAFPPVGASDHVACARFRLRRHRFHPLAAATGGSAGPYDLLGAEADAVAPGPTATDGGSAAPVRTVVQAAFRPHLDAWTECRLLTSDWRDLLMRARGVTDASAFARRVRDSDAGTRLGNDGADRSTGTPRPPNASAERIAARAGERAYDVSLRVVWIGERPAAVARRAATVGTAFAAASRGPTGQTLVPRSPADPRETLRDAIARWWSGGEFVLPLTEFAGVGPFPRAD